MKKQWFILLITVFGWLCFPSAQAEQQVVLKINGAVENQLELTRDDFKRYEQVTIDTETPWTVGNVRFQGPTLESVLELAGPKGRWVTLRALDSYQASANLDDIERYTPILAWKMDNQEMTLRRRGPLWLMFPIDDYDELKAHVYNDYMVWQLYEITVSYEEP